MASEEALELLRSIDASLKTLVALSQRRVAAAPKPVATDRDLDGKYGDVEIHVMPRDWSGPSFKGRRMSEAPAELLDLLAVMLDQFADNDERDGKLTAKGKPTAGFKRADAARARGWAARVRAGKHKPAADQEAEAPEWAQGGGDWQ